MMQVDLQQDFFSLFNLPARFNIDSALLEQNYRALQSQVHPDKFAHRSETERRVAMQQSTFVNEAFQTLRKPIDRARYLLTLHGVETHEETNTAMPLDFLMQQMDWREALESALAARDLSVIEDLENQLQTDNRALLQQLATALDVENDYQQGAGLVRKCRFLEKLAEEVAAAFDELDN